LGSSFRFVEAEVMADERRVDPDPAGVLDPEKQNPVSEGVRVTKQTQTAIVHLRATVEDTARVVAELAKANAVFESVADRLVAATFKASQDATRGGATHTELVAFVEELGDLARLSLQASGNSRRQLRDFQKAIGPTAIAFHQARTSLEAFSTLLARLVERPAPRAAVRPIEVETRPPPIPEDAISDWRTALAAAARDLGPSKSGGYKN
jgi:hypothetical protein